MYNIVNKFLYQYYFINFLLVSGQIQLPYNLQKTIIQTKKRRQDMTNSKDLSMASHQIKNMLSFINSSYQLIEMQHPEAADFQFWGDLGERIQDLITFMNRTTIYRQCEEASLEPLNITELIYELPDISKMIYPEQNRKIELDITPNHIQIDGNRQQLVCMFRELLSNCCEHTNNFDTVKISAHPDKNARLYYSISISNIGTLPEIDSALLGDDSLSLIKFQPDDSYILCKPFYTTKQKHVGIGLSIVKRICKNHNASLTFSQQDNLTTVHISFPIKEIM